MSRMILAARHGAGAFGPGDLAASGAAQPRNRFGYMFPCAWEVPADRHAGEKLDALAATMSDDVLEETVQASALPPILTYFGQFIDHDVAALAEADADVGWIEAEPLGRRPREAVEVGLANLRRGALRLDSLYGGEAGDGAAARLAAVMREGPRMRLGRASPVAPGRGMRPPYPADAGADLPRIGSLLEAGLLTQAEVEDLLRAEPTAPGLQPSLLGRRALIGDARNDTNLILSQLHLAWLRFHNAVVDRLAEIWGLDARPGALFEAARREVRWTFQWLVVNEFLPNVCDAGVLEEVLGAEAPLYAAFRARISESGSGGDLPVPLEFAMAAFRFGHSMVRASYDFNRNFGRPQPGNCRASLAELMELSGRGEMALDGHPGLPDCWLIEWNRFVSDVPAHEDRLARGIDSRLSPPLFELTGEPPGLFQRLAERNLRRGYALNLPSAQAVIAELACAGIAIRPLGRGELGAGGSCEAIEATGFDTETPLWFYILKEAELRAGGGNLGPLGSRIVAETLAGLVIQDRDSYWHAAGSDPAGRWTPRDGVEPAGEPVTSLAALLRAAGLLGAAD
ncbi:MAG TPA: heme peroxidase family protein [Paracoccaceae bacterium]|nr:heme peroxidase family protein [Paracoccaceae bacterium]